MGKPRGRSRILAAALLSLTALWGLSAYHVQAQSDPASRALLYLQGQQNADGSIPGSPSYDSTEQFIIGAAAIGYDPISLKSSSCNSALDYLAAHVVDASSSAGQTGELIEAVVAAGLDPTRFGGQNLLSLLASRYHADAGIYGDGQTFTQSLAILGLHAAGQVVPDQAWRWLLSQQDSDGGWNYLGIANDASGSDTNSTAMALMALAAVGQKSTDSAALAWFATPGLQDTDGGFPYQAGYGSDPNSDALVLQALIATGENPAASKWTIGSNTPYSYLIGQQNADGGFSYPGSPESAFTTGPLVAALGLQAYPVVATFNSGTTPAQTAAAAHQALLFLQQHQSATDGSVSSDYPSYAPTEQYIMGAVAAGYDPNSLSNGGPSAIDYLTAHVDDASDNAGDTGNLLLAIAAIRGNAHSFGGIDVVQTLLDHQYDSSTGAFATGDTFTQALAILGLAANGESVPQAAINRLLQGQDSDGGWNYTGNTNDPSGSDTNSTAMALMALAAAGDHSADGSALDWLKTQENLDGGFPYVQPAASDPSYPSPSDPDSDGLVVQALLAAHQNPSAWLSAKGNNVIDDLASLQGKDGGFPGYSGSDDVFTTAPLVAALERSPLPVNHPQVGTGDSLTGATFPAQQCGAVGGIVPPISVSPTPTAKPHTTPITQNPTPAAAISTPTATPIPAASPTSVPPLTGGTDSGTNATPNNNGTGHGFPVWLTYLLLASAAAIAAAFVALVRSRWT